MSYTTNRITENRINIKLVTRRCVDINVLCRSTEILARNALLIMIYYYISIYTKLMHILYYINNIVMI